MFNMGIENLNKDQFKMLQNKLIDTFKEYVLPKYTNLNYKN